MGALSTSEKRLERKSDSSASVCTTGGMGVGGCGGVERACVPALEVNNATAFFAAVVRYGRDHVHREHPFISHSFLRFYRQHAQ